MRRKGLLLILGNIKSGHHQTRGNEIFFFKKYLTRTRKLLETKLYDRNLIEGRNSCAHSFLRYSELFLKWTREELQQKTRKQITMHKALYPRNNINKQVVSRTEGGSGLPAFKIASIHRYKVSKTT